MGRWLFTDSNGKPTADAKTWYILVVKYILQYTWWNDWWSDVLCNI